MFAEVSKVDVQKCREKLLRPGIVQTVGQGLANVRISPHHPIKGVDPQLDQSFAVMAFHRFVMGHHDIRFRLQIFKMLAGGSEREAFVLHATLPALRLFRGSADG